MALGKIRTKDLLSEMCAGEKRKPICLPRCVRGKKENRFAFRDVCGKQKKTSFQKSMCFVRIHMFFVRIYPFWDVCGVKKKTDLLSEMCAAKKRQRVFKFDMHVPNIWKSICLLKPPHNSSHGNYVDDSRRDNDTALWNAMVCRDMPGVPDRFVWASTTIFSNRRKQSARRNKKNENLESKKDGQKNNKTQLYFSAIFYTNTNARQRGSQKPSNNQKTKMWNQKKIKKGSKNQ